MTSSLQHLCEIFAQLPAAEQQTLLAFAEFLASRLPPPVPVQPQLIPRPTEESVVAAIKRLAQSYPMLDKATMLDKTSLLMTEHILSGRDKVEVIDELEQLFSEHYQAFMDMKKDV